MDIKANNGILAIMILLTSCKNPHVKTIPIYNVEITIKNDLRYSPNAFERKIDTILATSDLKAYESGMILIHSERKAIGMMEPNLYSIDSYKITDSLGTDIIPKLAAKDKDSIDKDLKGLLK
ncbi:hypothetical protein [Pedobacter psychroterrae]|uniref:Uncharacterized protein n=1 Tax=Pedobacter psychroterrae TaxID=2530453 RepID=A0A4R0NEA1_9SPHI|nr:hypothetical protein [Pedobacter psychroterrae]TCC98037.1 hypothetical protein EZ437_19515 [Pedobacter psychroterrae]